MRTEWIALPAQQARPRSPGVSPEQARQHVRTFRRAHALKHLPCGHAPFDVALLVHVHTGPAGDLSRACVFLVTTLFGATPLWMAILADTGATVLVTGNALRWLRFKTGIERDAS